MGKSITRQNIPIAWVESGKIFPLPNTYSELPSMALPRGNAWATVSIHKAKDKASKVTKICRKPKVATAQPIWDFFTGLLGYICTKIKFRSYFASFFCSKLTATMTGRNQMLHGILCKCKIQLRFTESGVDFLCSSHLPVAPPD